MSGGRGFTIVVHRDGAVETRSFRLSRWTARALVALGLALALGLVVLAVTYGPVTTAAARVPFLERQVERLDTENRRVNELAQQLDEAEARYAHLRGMLGGDIALPEVTAAMPASVERLYVAPAILARAPLSGSGEETGPSIPHRWPLTASSYRTRGLAVADPSQESHSGLDLAVPTGSDVRAAGGGRVKQTGDDPAFGLFVLLEHPLGWETMYGHLSRVLVTQGDSVRAGQVIALSGNTGRSTAPHLHFEIRRGGRSVDPLSVLREGA